ncbi:MAG: diguanylate cyclase [Methylococcaceae bacterium]|nr:diguanylate cyclase [Methylococcaceae bacterium]
MNNKKPRILVVDDDPTSINILANILQESYDMSIALNGEQALRVVKKEQHLDMILLDIQMPEMDGYTLCKQLKANPETKGIPVMFITASNTEDDEQKGLELGAVDYITKPFHAAIVKARLKNHLELKHQRDFLEHLSYHDGLTGIYNRTRFDAYIQDEWRRAIRSQSTLSLIMIDIDNFKQFNDHYGHVDGDDCLKQVAKAIDISLDRVTDLVARYGGEEFSCVLPSTDLEGAVLLAEKIRYNVNALNIAHEKSLVDDFVSISLGVANINPTSTGILSNLIKQADSRLYKAKHGGRNQVAY